MRWREAGRNGGWSPEAGIYLMVLKVEVPVYRGGSSGRHEGFQKVPPIRFPVLFHLAPWSSRSS